MRFLTAELGFNCCFGENRRLYGGGYGNLLLSRFPICAVRNYDITAGQQEARGCLRADIEIGGATLHFFNVHLGTNGSGCELMSTLTAIRFFSKNSITFGFWIRNCTHLLATNSKRIVKVQQNVLVLALG